MKKEEEEEIINQQEQIFAEEFIILEKAQSDILNFNNLSIDEINNKFKNLVKSYNSLLKFSKKLSKISDIQGKELKKSEEEVKNILNHSNQGFLTIDKNFIIGKSYSTQCIDIFNKKIANLSILDIMNIDKSYLSSIFETSDNNLQSYYISKLPYSQVINNKCVEIEYKIIPKNSFNYDNDILIMMILTDITEKILAREEVEFLSNHDKLTSLYNRTYIEKMIPLLKSHLKEPLGMIFGDMNGLKLTNDVFGHHKGDELILSMANILRKSCWSDEIIARWSGDEFLIIISKATYEICENICQRIKLICSKTKWDPIGPSIALGISIQENDNFDFFDLFNAAEKDMYRNKLLGSKDLKKQIILSMEKILVSKCFETNQHADNVEDMALALASECGFLKTPSEIDEIKLIARLHDVGKVTIPLDILGKKQALDQFEWELIKNHSEAGFRMAQSINEPGVAHAILYLHEWWDGSGYPQGLAGEEIPLQSRIVAIAEAYDSMTSDRPYKSALTKEEAIMEIESCRGTKFDPKLVDIFIHILRSNNFK